MSLIPPILFLLNIPSFVTKFILTKTTIRPIGHTSQLKKYSKIQFIHYLSYWQKIEITFIVSQTLIATIPFHHLSPNLVQLRETMAKSKSKKKGNLNSQPSSPQIDNRGLYFEFFNLFDFKEFSKSLTFYVFLVCVVIFQLDRISEILWMGEIMNRSESSSVGGQRDGEHVQAPLWRGWQDGQQIWAPVRRWRGDEQVMPLLWKRRRQALVVWRLASFLFIQRAQFWHLQIPISLPFFIRIFMRFKCWTLFLCIRELRSKSSWL